MTLDIYQVDAFARGPFTGNPAAVCPLDNWLDDDLMQKIAMENNLSETAFFVKEGDRYHIRWFTPAIEVDLCGHATLASAFVIFNILDHKDSTIEFNSRSGILGVAQHDDQLTLNFPSDTLSAAENQIDLTDTLGLQPIKILKGKSDLLCVFGNESVIKSLDPDFSKMAQLPYRGLIVTAAGIDFDFVSRGFFPSAGINEDPATGSAHTTLTPYWHSIMKKDKFTACQLSNRKGFFECQYEGDRILISGETALYLKGEIYV